jgi:hypothetical protein
MRFGIQKCAVFGGAEIAVLRAWFGSRLQQGFAPENFLMMFNGSYV